MEAKVVEELAQPRGSYPHVKRAGDFLYVSGLSSRRPDNTFDGAKCDASGKAEFDIHQQTQAVIANIGRALAAAGAGLEDLVQVTTFLVDMQDFDVYNQAYAQCFSLGGPTRTTVAVHQLPHPHIRIEMNAVAYKPLR